MSGEDLDFVEWREEFVSQERGNRLVHYYLDSSSGRSFLAVVGTERSLRHMLYVIEESFCKFLGSDSRFRGAGGGSTLKWRSRREVVDWLTSFLPKQCSQRGYSSSPMNGSIKSLHSTKSGNKQNGQGSSTCKQMDPIKRKLKGNNSRITWSGVYWICCKQLKHYQAFHRNGTTISIHSFVLIMSEEEESFYLAYVEDMYEDSKGQNKVKVRWFQRHQEVLGEIPPPIPHPKEVFLTPCLQVISAEWVDTLAVILTPEHYEKCLSGLSFAHPSGVYICYRQYSKNKFKYFDISSLNGYFDQAILSCLDIYSMSGEEQEMFHQDSSSKLGSKRIRSLRGRPKVVPSHLGVGLSSKENKICNYKQAYPNDAFRFTGPKHFPVKPMGIRPAFASSFKVADKVEYLCQDSGIRGCWFRCTVLEMTQKRMKVQYDDIQDENENEKLEEWILAKRTAAQDRLEMRYTGRFTVRPSRSSDVSPGSISIDVGTAVDVWWHDGWWEGVVLGVGNCNDEDVKVYFPGEGLTSICQRKNIRISKDWVDNRWVNIEAKTNVLSSISALNLASKLSSSAILNHGSDSGASAVSEQKDTVELEPIVEEVQVENGLTKPEEASQVANGLMKPEEVDVQHENSRKRNQDTEVKDDVAD